MAQQGVILVTPEQLAQKSRAVRSQLRTMQGNFSKLKSQIEGTGAYWKGEAGDAARRRYLSKISKIEEMFRRYQEQVTDLEKMAGVYRQAEQTAAQAANQLPKSVL